MSVRLIYFSWVRERIGQGQEEIQLQQPTSVADLVQQLAARSAGHAAAFTDCSRLRAALNQQYCGFDTLVHDGDELAFFPPVTGGC